MHEQVVMRRDWTVEIDTVRRTLTLQTFWQRPQAFLKVSGAIAILTLTLWAGNAAAAYEYVWLTTSGPIMNATFRVADSAITKGVLGTADILGFTAITTAGTFNSLALGSALGVDPATGQVIASTNGITVTNLTDTLIISWSAFIVPSSLIQPKGKGVWTVTHLSDASPNVRLSVLAFTNGQPQLRITSDAATAFVLESSTDLLHWSPILTNQLVGGPLTISDRQTPVDPICFYRTVTAP